MSYEAFVLTKQSRERLCFLFPPKFSLWVGHHVTHRFGVTRTPNVPYGEQTHGNFEVIGYAMHVDGIEALVVRAINKTKRPDGGIYHITWSLDPLMFKPKDSNALIARGWTTVDPIGFDATFDYID
jgi:hypothetical protein